MRSNEKVITILRLRERSTLDWLERAFGFTLSEVTPTEDGAGLQHAQLQWGTDVIMASTAGKIGQPTGVASIYLTVATDDEVDVAYERALAEGASTVLVPEDQPYGGRNATVTDPEGNTWSIGSYHPTVA